MIDLRGRVLLAAALSGVALGLMLIPTPWLGWIATLPAAVASATLVLILVWQPPPSRLAATSLIASLTSVAVSLASIATGSTGSTPQGLWGMSEVAITLVLVAIVVRSGRGPLGVVALVAAAAAYVLWLVRFIPDLSPTGMLVWAIGILVAGAIGAYPRWAEHQQRQRVAQAMAEQRKVLERDLHDYVAHDVSGILAQAQAAQYATPDDAAALRDALADIEQAAQHALGTMDRTMALLRDERDGPVPTRPPSGPSLDSLPGLVDAFAATTVASVDASFDDGLAQVPDAVGAVVARVIVEALTNIRRHAPNAAQVRVTVECRAGVLQARVSNDIQPPADPTDDAPNARNGGSGLMSAAARIAALHGTLVYGPADGRWVVTATVPFGQ